MEKDVFEKKWNELRKPFRFLRVDFGNGFIVVNSHVYAGPSVMFYNVTGEDDILVGKIPLSYISDVKLFEAVK